MERYKLCERTFSSDWFLSFNKILSWDDIFTTWTIKHGVANPFKNVVHYMDYVKLRKAAINPIWLILVSSKWKSVHNNFLNNKISFWKQKNRIWKTILFCVYLIVLRSCNLVVCIALELPPRFLQTWIFFWRFLRYCASAFKVRSFEMWPCCNKKFMCPHCFSFCRAWW